MKQDCNLFHVSLTFCATPAYNEPLAEYISYLNLRMMDRCSPDPPFPELTRFKLTRFERISDTEYIIHGK